MELENIQITLRPRNPWEAMDLGLLMVQHWWRWIYPAWFAVLFSVTVIAHVVFFAKPWLACMVIWWLKPLYDRVLLLVYSRAMFGEKASLMTIVKQMPTLLHSGLLADLSYRRFSLQRAVHLPVRQLEGLHAKECKLRLRSLCQPVRAKSHWLIFACIQLEFGLQVGLIGLVYMFVPEHMDSKALLLSLIDRVSVLSNLLYLLPLGVVEPLYVAAGFGLYLNRRTLLEAWDIELQFRRLAERTKQPSAGTIKAAALALVVGLGCNLLDTKPGYAAEVEVSATTHPRSADVAADVIREVLKSKDFGHYETVNHWRWRPSDRSAHKTDRGKQVRELLASWSRTLGSVLGWLVETSLWTGLLVAGLLLYRFRHRWLPLLVRPQFTKPATHTPSGTVRTRVDAERLEPEIPDTVLALWQQGARRTAMSLLYRATLEVLRKRYGLEFAPGATETEILRAIDSTVSIDCGATVAKVLSCWQTLAYAHLHLEDDQVEQLCALWQTHLGSVV